MFEDNGWRAWAPAMEVVEVPGDHISMVENLEAETLAARMLARIEAFEAGVGTTELHAAE